jgi:hypothetical protein
MYHWYFAYGSNLLSDQMVARTGPIRTGDERPRIARLPEEYVQTIEATALGVGTP